METPAPSVGTCPAPPPGARRGRLLAILGMGLAMAAVVILSLRSRAEARSPEDVFYYLRDHVLQGDVEASWRVLLPEAKRRWAAFVDDMIRRPDGDPMAEPWRRGVGLSREELRKMTPAQVMARETLVFRDLYDGARVTGVDRWTEDLCCLSAALRGREVHWVLKRVDERWGIYDLQPNMNGTWEYTPPDGGPRIQAFPFGHPPDGAPADLPPGAPEGRAGAGKGWR